MTDDKGRLTVVHPADPLAGTPRPASGPSVYTAAGVMILATIVAYVFWLLVLIQLMGLAGDVKQSSLASVIYRGDFWDIVRGGACIVGAAALTMACWAIALGLADDD
jgi:hypothetical protein